MKMRERLNFSSPETKAVLGDRAAAGEKAVPGETAATILLR